MGLLLKNRAVKTDSNLPKANSLISKDLWLNSCKIFKTKEYDSGIDLSGKVVDVHLSLDKHGSREDVIFDFVFTQDNESYHSRLKFNIKGMSKSQKSLLYDEKIFNNFESRI